MITGQQFGMQTGLNLGTGFSLPKRSKEEEDKLRFPGFSDADIKKLYDKTAVITDEKLRKQAQDDLYRKVLPIIENEKKFNSRNAELNNLYYQAQQEKDPKQKTDIKLTTIMGELGNSIKRKFGLPADANDGEIITKFLQQVPKNIGLSQQETERLFQDYLNKGDEELLYVTGLKERQSFVDEDEGLLTNIKQGITAGVGIIAGAKLVGKVTEKLGRFIYGLTLTNPKEIAEQIKNSMVTIKENKLEIDRLGELKKLMTDPGEISKIDEQIVNIKKAIKLAEDVKPESITDIGLRTKGAVGTLKNVGTTIEATAKDTAKRFIEPILDETNKMFGNIKSSDIFKGVDEQIKNVGRSKGEPYAQQLREAFNDIKQVALGKKSLTDKEANAIKSGLYDLMTTKEKAGKISTNMASKAKSMIGKELTKIITERIKQADPTGLFLKEFKSYGARKMAGDIATKMIKDPGISNMLGTMSAVIKGVAAPITTVSGKILFQGGKLLQKPADMILKAGNIVGKGVKTIGKGLLAVDPIYTPDLLQHIPGTIGTAFKEYMETSPVGAAIKGLEGTDNIEKIMQEYNVDEELARDIASGNKIIFRY